MIVRGTPSFQKFRELEVDHPMQFRVFQRKPLGGGGSLTNRSAKDVVGGLLLNPLTGIPMKYKWFIHSYIVKVLINLLYTQFYRFKYSNLIVKICK